MFHCRPLRKLICSLNIPNYLPISPIHRELNTKRSAKCVKRPNPPPYLHSLLPNWKKLPSEDFFIQFIKLYFKLNIFKVILKFFGLSFPNFSLGQTYLWFFGRLYKYLSFYGRDGRVLWVYSTATSIGYWNEGKK